MVRKIFIFFIWLIIVTPVWAIDTNIFNGNMSYSSFRNILLPADANIVYSMAEDHSGMMWIGSKRGLFRYDGYKFHAFYNGKGSSGNSVQTLLVLDDNTLAVGTNDGLGLFDIKMEKYLPVDENFKMLGSVRSIVRDNNILYIGTREKGLFKYNLKTKNLSRIPGSGESIIYSILKIGNIIYVGTKNGAVVYNTKNGKIGTLPLHLPSQNNMVYCFSHLPNSDNLYVGTSGCVIAYSLSKHTYTFLHVPPSLIYRNITQDCKGTLICATDMGIVTIDRKGQASQYTHSARNPKTIANNSVWDVFCDSHGNVWSASNRGLSVSSNSLTSKVFSVSAITNMEEGNLLDHIIIDSHRNYWFGGDNGLILYHKVDGVWSSRWYRPDNVKWKLFDNNIHNIYEDPDGNVWIMTDESFSRYNEVTGKLDRYFLTGRNGRNTRWAYSMVEDSKHRLWIGTYMNGLFVVDKGRLIASKGDVKCDNIIYSNAANTIYQMFLDGKGYIWANTEAGLARINTKNRSIKTYHIYMDYMTINDGKVWYVAQGRVYCFDMKSEKIRQLTFSADNGIVYTLVPQGDRIWFTTAKGIYYVNVKNGNVNLYQITGDFYFSGCYDYANRQMIFVGDDRFLICNTDLQKNREDVKVYITGICQNGKLLEPGKGYKGESSRFLDNIKLKTRGNISLELSSLSSTSLLQQSFYYRIGDSDTWHEVENGGTINFANLPYGSFNLYLCTNLERAYKGKGISTYRFSVPYPWYLSVPMIMLYIVLILLGVFGIIYYNQQRNKRKYELKEREKTLELAQHKMDFFVNMSHELKTPLSLIIAPLSKLVSEVKNAKELEMLKTINSNAVKLNALIYRILDFKKMEYTVDDNLLRLHTEVVTLLRGCIGNFSASASNKHIEISFSTDVESLWMNVDSLKLESVFNNLLSNALKYVPENTGKVAVRLDADDKYMHVTIADNGKGVSSNDLSNVFTKFFQGENASNHEGSGIGLFLVKKFTEMHGGNVVAENDNGFKVTVSIPLTEDNMVTVDHVPSTNEEDEKDKTILIVDDNSEMLDFLTCSFENNYRCVTATNGLKAMKVMESLTPDLVIVDEMMPVMDGLTLVKNIRATQRIAMTPVIMLTAKDDEETEINSIKAGADIFMSKPFDLRKLRLHVVQLIQSRNAMVKQNNLQIIANPDFSKNTTDKDHDETFLDMITRCIEENMQSEDFNVAKLSELVGIDQKKIYRKLKQLIGKTPIAYLKQIRMKKAAALLKDGNFTVSEVMYLVGYSNASYFSKCFAEEYGSTPKDYQQNAETKGAI